VGRHHQGDRRYSVSAEAPQLHASACLIPGESCSGLSDPGAHVHIKTAAESACEIRKDAQGQPRNGRSIAHEKEVPKALTSGVTSTAYLRIMGSDACHYLRHMPIGGRCRPVGSGGLRHGPLRQPTPGLRRFNHRPLGVLRLLPAPALAFADRMAASLAQWRHSVSMTVTLWLYADIASLDYLAIVKEKVVPTSIRDSTQILPLWCSTIFLQVARPILLPCS
jgi:hypothetical protein